MDDSERLLKQVPLFSTLPEAELQRLASILRPLDVALGTILFQEGEAGTHFYIVRTGQIEVVKALGTPDERLIAVRGPGEFVGEMSLFNRDGLRTASVRAREPTQLWEMTRDEFDALLYRQPTLAYEMVRVLSMRLRISHDAAIRDLQEKNRRLAEAYEALQAAQAQIIEKEKLERELQLARDVQSSLIPLNTPHIAGWEIAALWQPAHQVAGDFYDFIPLGDGHIGVVIADVSGKGMPAALFMALSRSILRGSVSHAASPAECITRANRLICADAARSMFVTLCYLQLDPAGGQAIYVNAGHNPPLLYHPATGRWNTFVRTGFPLGAFDMFAHEQAAVHIDPGDCLLLYTDGVTEAKDARGEEFGLARLQSILRERHTAPAVEILSAIESATGRFIGQNAPYDDLTLVLIKRL